MKTEPTALAAGREATVPPYAGPEASAYGSQKNAFSSAQPLPFFNRCHGACSQRSDFPIRAISAIRISMNLGVRRKITKTAWPRS